MNSNEVLEGGNSNRVFKQGNTVVRNTGAWSPFIHQLLQYLTAVGFKESPVLLEHTNDIERLSFFAGEVGNNPLKPFMQSDEILIEAAKLLRKFHDVTQNFVIPPNAVFQLPVQTVHEVICHNDFAPYNCVFKDNHIVGIIDFDTAAPGTRLWDIAYAVYRFVPLANDTHCLNLGWQPIPDRPGRLKLFCDAYGLENRDGLMLTVRARLQALIDYMRETSSNLDHIPIYLDDLQYIESNQDIFTDALRV